MRLTDFWERMEARFGARYAESVARDQVLPQLGGLTVVQALAAGWSAKSCGERCARRSRSRSRSAEPLCGVSPLLEHPFG